MRHFVKTVVGYKNLLHLAYIHYVAGYRPRFDKRSEISKQNSEFR